MPKEASEASSYAQLCPGLFCSTIRMSLIVRDSGREKKEVVYTLSRMRVLNEGKSIPLNL